MDMRKWGWVVAILVMGLVVFGGWYGWHMKYGKPIELLAAEHTLKQIMKAPDTFVVKSAKFKMNGDHPEMIIEYSSKNPLGVPLSGRAKFIYKNSPEIPPATSDSSSAKLARELKLDDFKKINAGELKKSSFEYTPFSHIEIDGINDPVTIKALEGIYSANKIILDKSNPFRSKIGGTVTKVDAQTGKIDAVNPPHFSREYIPGEIFPWKD